MNVVAKKTSTNAVKKIDKQLDKLLKEKRSLDDTASMPKVNTAKRKNTDKTQQKKSSQSKKKSPKKKDVVIVEERKKVSKKKESVVVVERDEKNDSEKAEILEHVLEEENYSISDDIEREEDYLDENDIVDSKKSESQEDIEDVINTILDDSSTDDTIELDSWKVDNVQDDDNFLDEGDLTDTKTNELYDKVEDVIGGVLDESFIDDRIIGFLIKNKITYDDELFNDIKAAIIKSLTEKGYNIVQDVNEDKPDGNFQTSLLSDIESDRVYNPHEHDFNSNVDTDQKGMIARLQALAGLTRLS